MSLNNIIMTCASSFENEGVAFDADDVLVCLYRDHADEVSKFGQHLARAELRRRVSIVLKRSSGEDPNEEYEQLSLHGFEKAPKNVPFYDGERVRYIPTLGAKRAHLKSAIKLRDDNIRFCEDRRAEYRAMLDLIEQHKADITFGEAIKREQHATT